MISFPFETQRPVYWTCVTSWFVLLAAVHCCNGVLHQETVKIADSLPSASESSTMPDMTEQPETAAVDLGSLLDAGDGAIVTLVAGDTRLTAHRAVLAAGSPILAAMLRPDTLEAGSSEVEIPDMEGHVLRQLVAFLYTGRAPQLPSMALQLLAAAERYGVSALSDSVQRQVAENLSVENAVATAVVALRYNSHSRSQAAVAFIRDHLEVLATKGWAEAVLNHPAEAVQITHLLTVPPAKTSATTTAHSTPSPTTAAARTHSDHGQTAAAALLPTAGHPTPLNNAPAMTRLHANITTDNTTTSSAVTTGTPAAADIMSVSTAATPAATPTATTAIPTSTDSTSISAATATAVPMGCNYTQLPNATAISFFGNLTAKEKGERLIQAAKDGSVQEVSALLATGADLRARDKWGYTALYSAASRGHAEVVRCLLQLGAEVHGRDGWQFTPLHWAAQRGHTAVVQLLLAVPADLNATDVMGKTPLHWAAENGRTAVVHLLLAASADPNASDKDGWRPLHLAAGNGKAEAATVLLQAGADKGATTNRGWTALDVAREYNQLQLIQMLQ